jgi:hypothetical protein
MASPLNFSKNKLMKKLFLLLAFLPLPLSAAEENWAGTGSFHSSAFGKHENVPVSIKITITDTEFASMDCWELSSRLTSCSMQSFAIQNGNELWREGVRVGSLVQNPLEMSIAYSTRGVEITSQFRQTAQTGLNFAYTFSYPTGSYMNNSVENLQRAQRH